MSDNSRSFTWSIDPSDNAMICFVCLCLLSGLIAMFCLANSIGEMNTRENLAAINAGLVQVPNQGTGGYHWDRPAK